MILSLMLMFATLPQSAGAVTVDLDDDKQQSFTSGTIYDTDWSYSQETKTLSFKLSDTPDWSTSGGQTLIPDALIAETEHVVVDSNCSNSSSTGLLNQWLLGYNFTELAVSLKDVTVEKIDGQPQNFSSHDGVLFVVHEGLVETNDEVTSCSEATLFVYPRQKTDSEFTLKSNETLIYDGFRDLYYIVLAEYPLCRSLNYNEYLENMNVESGNIFGCFSENGVVYTNSEYDTENGRKLIFCPKTRTGAAPISEFTESIGAYAFTDCKKLTSVQIPSSVRHIGARAFYNCTSLESASLSDYIDPDIPGYNTRSVEDQAFAGCTALKTLYIGFGQEAGGFGDCTALESVTIADGVEVIANEAFVDCSSLKEIVLPDSLRMIGRYAFMNCTSLENITLPASLDDIGERAFFGCKALKTAEIQSKKLGCPEWYRENLEFLDSYTDSVQALRPGIFSNCPSLTDIKVTEENPALYVKDGVLYQRMIFRDRSAVIENIELPELLHIVGYEAGDDREELDLSVETDITYLTEYAFFGAHNLKTLTLPESVEIVGRSALSECGLTSFEFPSRVGMIWGGVLSDCHELREVVFPPHVHFDLAVCVNDEALKTYTFKASAIDKDHETPFKSADGVPDIGGKRTADSADGVVHLGVVDGITIRANRFFSGALGYSDEFYELADLYGWTFEDLATGESFDLSDPEKKPVSRYQADTESGVIVSISAERSPDRGYEFDISAETSDHAATGENVHALLIRNGDHEQYCNITISADNYIESARYNGAEGYEVRLPAVGSAEVFVDNEGVMTQLDAVSAEGYVIVKLGADNNTDPDPDDTKRTYGDLDGDGQITSSDALIVLRLSAGLEAETPDNKKLADIDEDGLITSNDALSVLRVSAGMSGNDKIGKPIG